MICAHGQCVVPPQVPDVIAVDTASASDSSVGDEGSGETQGPGPSTDSHETDTGAPVGDQASMDDAASALPQIQTTGSSSATSGGCRAGSTEVVTWPLIVLLAWVFRRRS